ncbi:MULTISPECIES: hypothetical protein [unclassified Streptomyces]|uniref:hypothetical protein n=1 Tax=unclassified Streptomyces TaxID=2593676 RepID=UPI00081D957D|nr:MULTISPECIES: hypothetical protein [unclassified Streptomyces]MYZ40617.1 hypothetical protein [Streptomyces sp. SID4917]SCG08150.1 hypothetical protein GA0115259_1124411 [Streptomyces sp. MnatMP-M17]
MTWPVALHPDIDRRLERLILPDQALADGRLITPPDVAEAASRRRALFAVLTGQLGRNPYAARLGTTPARLPRQCGTAYASVVQDDTEALHAWWCWAGLHSSVQALDVAYTPRLPAAPDLGP